MLYSRYGIWNGKQIISSDWIEKSTATYSSFVAKKGFPFTGYGFMWWTADFGHMVSGYGGHMIAIIPSADIVIVHRVDNGGESDIINKVSADTLNVMVRLIINSVTIK